MSSTDGLGDELLRNGLRGPLPIHLAKSEGSFYVGVADPMFLMMASRTHGYQLQRGIANRQGFVGTRKIVRPARQRSREELGVAFGRDIRSRDASKDRVSRPWA
jgi:hypothetical protein